MPLVGVVMTETVTVLNVRSLIYREHNPLDFCVAFRNKNSYGHV